MTMTLQASTESENSEHFRYSFEKKYQDRIEVYDHDICSMIRKTTTFYDNNKTITEYIIQKPSDDVLLEFTLNSDDTFRLCKDDFAINLYTYVIYDKKQIAKNNYWLANHPKVGVDTYKIFVEFSYKGRVYKLEQNVEPKAPLMLHNRENNSIKVIEEMKGSLMKVLGKLQPRLAESIYVFYAPDRYTIKSYKKREMISIVNDESKSILYYKIGDAPDSPLLCNVYSNNKDSIYLDATEAITRIDLKSAKRDTVLTYDVGSPSYFMYFNKKGDGALIVLLEFDPDDKAYENLYYVDLKSLQTSKIASYEYTVPEGDEGEYMHIKDAIFSAKEGYVVLFFEDGKRIEIKYFKEEQRR